MKKLRILIGALVAPACVPLLYFLLIWTESGYIQSSPGHFEKLVEEFFFAVLPASYGLCVLIGGPILMVLWKQQKLDRLRLLAFAAVAGWLVGFALTYVFDGPPEMGHVFATRLAVAVVAMAASSITALAFCMMAGISGRWTKMTAHA